MGHRFALPGSADEVRVPLMLNKPVDINLTHGKPNGVYHIAAYAWKNAKTEL